MVSKVLMFNENTELLPSGDCYDLSPVLMFHENTELIPSGDCYDLYPVNNNPNKHIMLVLVGIPVINQPNLVEVAKKDRA